MRIFSCAHSFHWFTPPNLTEMALAAGYQDHVQIGVSGIGGSRVIQHWDVPEEKNEAKAALRAGNVDVLTLSPIWLPDEGLLKFAQLAVDHNPNIRVTVQEFWLPNDTYEPVYPLQENKVVDHNATDLVKLRQQHDLYFRDIEAHVGWLNRQLGRPAALIVPTGQAVLALREKISAGHAFGARTQAELFEDSWGHATVLIKMLATYCHFGVIYRRSPVGLPMPTWLVNAKNPNWEEKLNRLMQELAWDAVTQHPLSGVNVKS